MEVLRLQPTAHDRHSKVRPKRALSALGNAVLGSTPLGLALSLVVVAVAFTAIGLSRLDSKGLFLNLCAEAWGAVATVLIIENTLQRHRSREEAPMRRLVRAEELAILHSCAEAARAAAEGAGDQLERHVRRAVVTADRVGDRYARYIDEAELVQLFQLGHAAELVLAQLHGSLVSIELERLATEAERLRDILGDSQSRK